MYTGIKTGVSLKEHTSYRIGGRAKYFAEVEKREDLINALKFAKENHLPFLVLGKGTNVLASDKDYQGLVIKISLSGIKRKDFAKKVKFNCGSGFLLPVLLKKIAEEGLSGFEWAAGVPGTIGGAVYGNSGAYGKAISNSVVSITTLNTVNGKVKKWKKEDCDFSYKASVFKKKPELVILEAELSFEKGDPKEVLEEMKRYLKQRREKQPLDFPSAGSVFKNPEVVVKNKKILEKFPEFLEFNKKGQIPAGFLIEKCGLKEKKFGGAQISEKHANFIINRGNAKAKDVLRLISLAKTTVKKKFGIKLEEEIQFFGF